MRHSLRSSLLLSCTAAVLTLAPMSGLRAQDQGLAIGRPEWTPAVRHDTSRPLREIPALPPNSTREDFQVKQGAPLPEPGQADGALQPFAVSAIAAAGGIGFDGVGVSDRGDFTVQYAPPDTVGEAGLTQFVQWVNPAFAIFDKATGTQLYGPAAGNTLWQGFGGPCQSRNDGDPIVQYDQLANRWVMTQFALQSGNYMQCVAISQSSDATGSWYRYAFSYSAFPDYPKLSVWPDAYYVTFNMFGGPGGSFSGGRVCAYDRAKMLAGQPATQICHEIPYPSLLATDLEGLALPPAGTPNYVVNRGSNSLNVWRFTPNFSNGTSTFTGPTAIPVSSFAAACSRSCVPQPSTSQKLDALGDRLMYRLSYRNLGTREALVVNHSVNTGSLISVRWYELDVTGGTVTVRQQSTYAPGDGLYRWMGSIGMDQAGNIAVGYSVGSATTKPSIRFAGRDVNDPLNTLSIEDSMQVGTGSQLATLSRWGDYSSMSIDPVDDCTFWYTSEYLKTDGKFNWSTRIGSFKFVSCGSSEPGEPTFSLGVAPSSRTITQGQSTTFDATVTALNGYTGDGSFSVSGLPANATPSWSNAGYTGGAGASTLTIDTTTATAPGSYAVTITASDGTITQSSVVTLTVLAAPVPDFTLSVSPSNRTVKRGNATTYTVTVTASGGFSEAVTLSVSGQPAATTITFSTNPIAGSGSATMTVQTTNPGTPKGAVTLTITGTSTPVTRSATVTLRVQ